MLEAIVERISYVWGLLRQIGNLFSSFFNILIKIINFISDAVYFLIFVFRTIVNYIVKAFHNIFWLWFFDQVNWTFDSLTTYLWGFWTTVLVSLFSVAFFLILFGFVMRLLKWQINYNSAIRQLDKQSKHKK